MRDTPDWIQDELSDLKRCGLLRQRSLVRSLPDGWCEVAGRRLRDFASNDYLHLAHDPRLRESAHAAISHAGIGARASALVTGRTPWHARLENEIAEFEDAQSAVLFPTGFAANLGTIPALVGTDDIVFSDRLNHASLLDGGRLSGARLRVFRHERLATLERELEKSGGVRRRLITTDAVFSMDGDLAPLREICDLAEAHDAMLLVDEAHATGLFGDRGRGLCEQMGVEDRVTVRIGTLSKALGCLGGFVAGTEKLTDWIWNRARTQFFSTALPPAICAAAATAIEIVKQEPWRRQTLLTRSRQLRQMMCDAGLRILGNAAAPIIPVLVDDANTALAASRQLAERGFLVPAIRPPTVPRDMSRLRISLSCVHDESELAALAQTIAEVLSADRTSESQSVSNV